VSRIGKLPIEIPGGVEIKTDNGLVTVKGPKGTLSRQVSTEMKLEQQGNTLLVTRPSDERKHRALHGLTRTLINNMVVGVTTGFTRNLIIEGVGFRAEMKGKALVLNLGYSHPIYFYPPDEVEIKVPQPTRIEISGINKELVGQVAAKIRSFRKPEPYKGKGVRYEDEVVRRKAGKTGK
jgi:large subunit ribosomal protein L6